MQETWRLLVLIWSIGLLVVSCASVPQPNVIVEVFERENAQKRSVAVVPDLFMDDPAQADKVASLMRDQLVANGFKVHEAESDAELIVIATIERSKPMNTGGPAPTLWRSVDVPYPFGQANMMESGNALRHLGFEFASSGAPEQLKAGLMVTAITRETWLKGLADQPSEIPRVWRIIAVSPLKKKDVTAELVEAVGSKLNKVSGGRAGSSSTAISRNRRS